MYLICALHRNGKGECYSYSSDSLFFNASIDGVKKYSPPR